MEESFAIVNDAGLTIRGVIARPKQRGKFPLVVIATDFFDTSKSPNVKEASRFLLQNGIAVVKFDFTNGFGKSDGRVSDITISQQARDIEEVTSYAKRRAYINEKKVSVMGFGFGAMSALVLEGFESLAKSLLLVNTPKAVDETLWTKFSERDMMRVKLKRYFHIRRDSKEVLISYTFFEDGMRIDMARCARNLRTPVLFLAGENCKIIPPDHSKWFFERIGAKKEYVVMPGIGSIKGKKGIKAIIEKSVGFLKKQNLA